MKIDNLLKQLTTKEKIGQLLQLAPFYFDIDLKAEVAGRIRSLNIDREGIFMSGSVLGISNASEMIKVQQKYLDINKHKIPLMFMADIIHGYETIFPVPIALASSFNPLIAFQTARISAIEASTAGIHVTFSPMADLSRDPRWGRVVESFGEDPYLAGVFSAQMVKGYQNEGIEKIGNLAACVKHFAAYGASEAGRDYNTVDVSKTALYNMYLKSYKTAIDAGAKMMMTAFNVLDGVPATINKYLLRTVLRDQWKSDAVTISDYDSLKQVLDHGCAENEKDAAYRAIQAGLDIEMASVCYVNYLEELIDEGIVDIKKLDEAVLRVLQLKKDLGLFEDSFKGASIDREKELVRSKEHLKISKKVALESAVLLKNEQTLPLNKKQKIALIGPYAKSKSTNGPWSWHGKIEHNLSLEEVFSNNNINLTFVSDAENIDQLSQQNITQIEASEVVVLALGEDARLSGEAHSRSDIKLPNHQDTLVKLARSLNKEVVVILFNGRPLDLSNIMDSNAILETWFLGSRATEAIFDLIYGHANPSGKLPMSFPRTVGQIPVYYNHLNTGRPLTDNNQNYEYLSRFLDVENTPLFSFGHGLSYASFKYSDLEISQIEFDIDTTLRLSINVTNESQIPGHEVVQLYIRDHVAKISRPVKELKKFKKIWLEGKQTQTVVFELDIHDLSYFDSNGNETYDSGKFTIMVGSNSQETLNIDIWLKGVKHDYQK
ncbi:MAG: glycoside hydrolase family 3 C-terminal domain-containing protein [Tenericutes bacterium]|nr:glycoside hydrolase family 3 C-terminal domain-containing protein [Mycoplasmatota bacterium]